jgi:hypothetical protein
MAPISLRMHADMSSIWDGVRCVLFGVIVMVPLFYVDLPGGFSGADALMEHEHAVRIVL